MRIWNEEKVVVLSTKSANQTSCCPITISHPFVDDLSLHVCPLGEEARLGEHRHSGRHHEEKADDEGTVPEGVAQAALPKEHGLLRLYPNGFLRLCFESNTARSYRNSFMLFTPVHGRREYKRPTFVIVCFANGRGMIHVHTVHIDCGVGVRAGIRAEYASG